MLRPLFNRYSSASSASACAAHSLSKIASTFRRRSAPTAAPPASSPSRVRSAPKTFQKLVEGARVAVGANSPALTKRTARSGAARWGSMVSHVGSFLGSRSIGWCVEMGGEWGARPV